MLAKFGSDSVIFKFWRCRVVSAIRTCKRSFYQSKVKKLKDTNKRKWWREVKNQDKKQKTGQSISQGEWYSQLIGESSIASIDNLYKKINELFVQLTSDFRTLLPKDVTAIVVPDVPGHFLVSSYEAYKSLRGILTNKAPGPDGIPALILKMFAFELSPIVAELYNTSLKEGHFPGLLKSANVRPLPKLSPPKSIKTDIRPISLTSRQSNGRLHSIQITSRNWQGDNLSLKK
ncbi:uncharacterized protein LOC125573855 [Nematostella vectensis]|uniref:uncharacterized protein LOC125573855 n=1 Tax=Nematostella vectensis TaxID=45351 RepID=UPI00207710F1|nr:uncharacterized protein LOC125573855 [Nematostella vectensis]